MAKVLRKHECKKYHTLQLFEGNRSWTFDGKLPVVVTENGKKIRKDWMSFSFDFTFCPYCGIYLEV